MDKNNGLLLSPTHHRLFDLGFISFDDNGFLLISKKFTKNTEILKLQTNKPYDLKINEKRKEYLKFHRENIFENETQLKIKTKEVY